MKKLILLASLLIVSLVQAQQSNTDIILAELKQRDEQRAADKKAKEQDETITKHSNADYAYLTSLKKIVDDKEALKMANDIASIQTKRVKLLRAKDFPENNFYIVRFIPDEMTTAQYDALDESDQHNFLTVRFYYWNEGENADLEIKGVKTYRLSQITGSYLQLFSVWKKYCKYDADLAETQKGHNSFKDISEKLNFLFYKEDDNWILMNRS